MSKTYKILYEVYIHRVTQQDIEEMENLDDLALKSYRRAVKNISKLVLYIEEVIEKDEINEALPYESWEMVWSYLPKLENVLPYRYHSIPLDLSYGSIVDSYNLMAYPPYLIAFDYYFQNELKELNNKLLVITTQKQELKDVRQEISREYGFDIS
jgi:hypothetical protein